jgi:O-antigen biosynthesis protein
MTLIDDSTNSSAPAPLYPSTAPIRVDGKFFTCGGRRFPFHGVSYGTFRARADGLHYPERPRLTADFAAMQCAGFSVVRTYEEPPLDVLDVAAEHDLRIFAGVFWKDWRYLVGGSRRQQRELAQHARSEVRDAARRLAGRREVFALCLGNEVPADVVRWIGHDRIASLLEDLTDVVRDVDPERLVTYANYPSTEYLEVEGVDFLTFNVFLDRPADLRRYLTRLQHLAADRPLVLGEIGHDALDGAEQGETAQAASIDSQLRIAVERGVAGTCLFSWTDEWSVNGEDVEGWHFGLTTADRSPRPALEVASRWAATTVRDLAPVDGWPSISVVVCAYNAAETIDECLAHTCALDYPSLEILVIDDGSTDATAEISRRHPRAIVATIDHAGLSVARNEGLRLATSDIVAYLDSDAYPAPEWLYYLSLGFDGRFVGGVGGPNVSPPTDPLSAQRVAQASGGPQQVLFSDDRAEHVPGCNMAFYRSVLEEVGGCDPIYTAAGDDVDLCWKVLDRGWEIGFHPAALVWHHRRGSTLAYVRQQMGYGRAETLVAQRHPDRFNVLASARWRGHIYGGGRRPGRPRIYRGAFGTAAYQSIYRGGGATLDIAQQAGVPVATVLLALLPLGLIEPAAAWLGFSAVLFLLVLLVIGALNTDSTVRCVHGSIGEPRRTRTSLLWRFTVSALCLVQPLARTWGRLKAAMVERRSGDLQAALPGPLTRIKRNVVIVPAPATRSDVTQSVLAVMRAARFTVLAPTGWESHDAQVLGSMTMRSDIVTSGHVPGWVHVRVSLRPRPVAMAVAVVVVAVVAVVSPVAATAATVLLVVDAAIGVWQCRFRTMRRIIAAAGGRS